MTNPTHNSLRLARRRWLLLAAGAALGSAGCATTEEGHCFFPGTACQTIPPGALPAPNGTYACQWQQAQMARAEADDFVVYQREWNADSTGFGPAGYRHVNTIAERLLAEPHYHAVLVEPSRDQPLDERRAQVLIAALAERGVTDAAERVRIALPAAEPLLGVSAPRVAAGYVGRGGVGGGGQGGGQGGFSGGSSFRSGGGGALGGGFGF